MAEKLREYTTEPQDHLILRVPDVFSVVVESGIPLDDFRTERTISESEITAFCSGCDHFKGHGVPCENVGSNDQARYAARRSCGWAKVNGKRTTITG